MTREYHIHRSERLNDSYTKAGQVPPSSAHRDRMRLIVSWLYNEEPAFQCAQCRQYIHGGYWMYTLGDTSNSFCQTCIQKNDNASYGVYIVADPALLRAGRCHKAVYDSYKNRTPDNYVRPIVRLINIPPAFKAALEIRDLRTQYLQRCGYAIDPAMDSQFDISSEIRGT